MDIHYRENKLMNMGLPKDYVDVYMYCITNDSSYLSEEYFVVYPYKRMVNVSKIKKRKEELLLLFGRLLIYGDLIGGE